MDENRVMAPKISVCIPTYNYAHYLPFAIESILSQEFTDFELIIVDDCSRDNTEEVVSRFQYDKRVSFEKNERNLGLVANWNKCLSKAEGEYIKFVFADDALASDQALGRMASILDLTPSISLVASARHLIDSESRITGLVSRFPPDYIADGADVISRCLREDENLIGEPTAVMFRKVDSARGFDERYQQIVDLEMWFHLLEKGRFAFVAESLASFRVHPDQKTKENVAQLRHLDDQYLLLRQYLRKPYTQFNFVIRFFVSFSLLYSFHKYEKKGKITKKEAKRRIRGCCSLWYYYLLYPVYKLVRLFLKPRPQAHQKIREKQAKIPVEG